MMKVWLCFGVFAVVLTALPVGNCVAQDDDPGAGRLDLDYEPIVEKVVNQIARQIKGTPRIAVFSTGNAKGGIDENSVVACQTATNRFVSNLRSKLVNKAFVVGPTGIRQELDTAGKLAFDPSQIDSTNPNTVKEWINTTIPGVFDAVILPRLSENRYSSELSVLMVWKDGHVSLQGPLDRPIGIEEDALLPPSDSRKRHVVVRLYAVDRSKSKEEGDSKKYERFLLPLKYREQRENRPNEGLISMDNFCPPLLAMVPSELEDRIGEGKLHLEIELEHSGKAITGELVDGEKDSEGWKEYCYHVLRSNPSRLLCCAVSIDGKSTVAEEVVDTFQPNQNRFIFPENKLQIQMRKWIMPQKGMQIRYVKDKTGNLIPALNPDQSPIIDASRDPRSHVVSILGFQKGDENANSFLMKKPSLGNATTANISTTPGLIRVTVYAQKLKTDGKRYEVMGPADDGVPLSIEEGGSIPSRVVSLRVDHYRPPIEEFVILLRLESQIKNSEGPVRDFIQAVTH